MVGATLSDRAAVSNEGIKDDAGAVSGLNICGPREPGRDLREQLKQRNALLLRLREEKGEAFLRSILIKRKIHATRISRPQSPRADADAATGRGGEALTPTGTPQPAPR